MKPMPNLKRQMKFVIATDIRGMGYIHYVMNIRDC